MTIQAECSAPFHRLAAAPVDRPGDTDLVAELPRLERLIARAEARRAEIVAIAHRRGVPQGQGSASPTAWLIATTGEPPSVCRRRVRVALTLRMMPHTAAAFARGDLFGCRVRLLADACASSPEVFARDESLPVSHGRSLPGRALPRALCHWQRLADPDGARADAGRAFEHRRLCVSATWQGMVRLDGDLDPESGAVVMHAVGSLAEPWGLEPGDTRSPHQRRADTLLEICRRHLDSPQPALPGRRTAPPGAGPQSP